MARRKNCAGKKSRRQILLWIGIAAALLLAGRALEKNLAGVILDMAHARAEAMAVEYMHEAVREVLGDEVTYEDMITVRTDAQGRVTMRKFDS